MATQNHLCQLPIQQEKRDLVTKPIQPDDVEDDSTVGIILWSLSSTTRALIVAVSLVLTAAEAVGVRVSVQLVLSVKVRFDQPNMRMYRDRHCILIDTRSDLVRLVGKR